jgi:type VI secretion system protein ImpD
VIPKLFFPSLLSRLINTINYCPVLGTDISKYKNVLGIGAYALASVIITSFVNTGWFLHMIGMPRNNIEDEETLGLIPKVKADSFFNNGSDKNEGFYKYTTEFFISEQKEKELSELGFMPICHFKSTEK